MRLRFWRRREEDLDEELQSHLQMAAEERVERGESPAHAEQAARREFGNIDLIKEITRDMWGWRWLVDLRADTRFGLRMLRKSPAFTIVAVLTLALGIGANTAIFSIVDAVMLKNLPVQDPAELIFLHAVSSKGETSGFSYEEFQQIKEQTQSLASVFAFDTTRLIVTANGRSDFIWAQCVSGNFFSMLGLVSALGRNFDTEDDAPVRPPVAIVSYEYWRTALASDPAVVGKSILLKNLSFNIVGVAPRFFRGIELGDSVQLWVPMAYWRQLRLNDHTDVAIMGRIKPSVTQHEAEAELTVIDRQAISGRPKTGPEGSSVADGSRRVEVSPGNRGQFDLPDDLPQQLHILMAVAGLVLLIVSANLANLVLARTANREKEFALRIALGAGRFRLIRQLLVENLVLAVAGGGFGLIVAVETMNLLLFASSELGTLARDIRIDAPILYFSIGASLLTGLLFGLTPAFRASGIAPVSALKAGGSTGSRSHRTFQQVLVISQIALSAALSVGAGLLVRTLRNLARVDPGFRQENVVLASLYPTLSGYQGARELNLYAALQDRISAIPGVESASFSRFALLGGGRWRRAVQVIGEGPAQPFQVYCNPVAPAFFETMKIPVVLGREISPNDGSGAPAVVVVSEAFSRGLVQPRDLVGQVVEFQDDYGPVRAAIVGVVKDVRLMSLRQADALPAVYIPIAQAPADMLGQMTMEIRSGMKSGTLVPVAREAARRVDPGLPFTSVTTQAAQTEQSFGKESSLTTLISLFDFLALFLAGIGLYGVLAHTVAQRTHEIGVRLAMGAQPAGVMQLVISQGVTLALIGVALGLSAAFALTRWTSSLLFGVTANDPPTLILVVSLLIILALTASYIPARRAMRVGPMVVLRHE